MPGVSGLAVRQHQPGGGRPARRRDQGVGLGRLPRPTTATCSGPASAASATASVHPAKRGSRAASCPDAASAASARSRMLGSPVRAEQREQRAGQGRLARGLGVVGGAARAGEQGLGVVAGVVEARRPSPRTARPRCVEQVPCGRQPARARRWPGAGRAAPRRGCRSRRRRRRRVPDRPGPRGPAQPAVDEVRRARRTPRTRAAASTRSGAPSSVPASARPAMARPFQEVTTLSSRAGCGRVRPRPRAAASALRAHHAGVVGVGAAAAGWTMPCSKVPAVGDGEQRRPPRAPSSVAEHLAELGGCPGVGQALDAVGVGVERRGETALVGAQVAQQELGGLQGDPAGQRVDRWRGAGARRPAAAGRCRRASSRSAAPPSARRRSSGRTRRRAGRRCRRAPSPRRCWPAIARASSRPGAGVVAQQELQHHRRRELRRAAESRCGRGRTGRAAAAPRRVEDVLVEGLPGDRAPTSSRSRAAMCGAAVAGRGRAASVQASRDAREQLEELALGEVGAGEERVAVGREEAGHRPAAVAGQRGRRRHVDRVDVGALLAVDLDRDEVAR